MKTDLAVTIGNKIREAREAASLSQWSVCMATGAQPAQVSRWEKGLGLPSIPSMILLARALNKPVAWFFEGVE